MAVAHINSASQGKGGGESATLWLVNRSGVSVLVFANAGVDLEKLKGGGGS